MLVDCIFLFILFVLVYSYTSYQNQFSATASAIRQIWSGNCRLLCRQSERSELSGLSGLPPHYSSYGRTHETSPASLAGPSRNCNCESCPCELIEHFLSTFRPATTIYGLMIECTSNCVTYFMQILIDAYDYVLRVFECSTACQRPVQMLSEKQYLGSRENISFGKADKQVIAELKSSIERKSEPEPLSRREYNQKLLDEAIAINKASGSTTLETVLKGDVEASHHREGTSKEEGPKINDVSSLKDDEKTKTLNPPVVSQTFLDSSDDSVLDQKGYCSKCIKKGRTCVKECPRAKSNKK